MPKLSTGPEAHILGDRFRSQALKSASGNRPEAQRQGPSNPQKSNPKPQTPKPKPNAKAHKPPKSNHKPEAFQSLSETRQARKFTAADRGTPVAGSA